MKKVLALIFAALVVVTSFASCGNNTDEGIKIPEETLIGVERGSLSKFKAIDLAGNEVDEDIFKGKKLTMINIWATFCRPCISEMPYLEEISKNYADKGLQVIGMVSDVEYNRDGYYDNSLYQRALDIVEMTGVTFTNLLPSKSLNKIKLNEVYSVPETIFVDENGNIIGKSYIGSRTYENWASIVDDILSSMPE